MCSRCCKVSKRPRVGSAATAATIALTCLVTVVEADESLPYSLAALGTLTCSQIDAKLNEGIAAGDAEAAYSSAQLLIRRVCFRYDPKAYVVLLQKAADGGHKRAQWDLGYAIGLGEGAPQSYAKAGELISGASPRTYGEKLGNAAPEQYNYTVGYGHTLIRLATREVNGLPRHWWKHDHVVRVEIRLHTPDGEHSISVKREGPVPEGGESEVREAEKLVLEAAEDSFRKAVKKLPAPDKALLVEENFVQPVNMLLYASTSNRRPTAGEVDIYLPR